MSKHKTWDQYVKEADHEPFRLQVSDKQTITVEQPTGEQIITLQRIGESGDVEDMLVALCGHQAGADLLALFKDAPARAMLAVINDITTHFGLGDPGEALTRI